MSNSASCIECGSAVPPDAPDGICPACLWQLGLSAGPAGDELASTAAASTFRSVDQSTPLVVASPPRRSPGANQAAGALLPVIRRLGNYDLVEELGRGGMGIVFKAVQRQADRLVAVKVIQGGSASGEESRVRFRSEVQTLARLRHPNIVPVFEVGDEEGCPYFSMEYMPGGSLAEQAKQTPLPQARAASTIEQLAGAVEAAHQVGVLHRDIKPSNILLDEAGTPKLSDFGLAKRLDSDEGVTHTGSILGTPGYMPPEQARGQRDLTPAADVYSLGATLYALLIGRAPFGGRNFDDAVQHVIQDDPPRPRARRPEISRDLEAVCLKCLEKDPQRRYASAQALADDLARWRQGASTVARPQTLPQRAARQLRRHWRMAAVVLGLAAIGVAAALIVRSRDPLVQLDAALHRGQIVRLIGPTGPPRWQHWIYGTGGRSVNENGPVEYYSGTPSHIELIPTTHHAHFRLSAEFKAERSLDHDSWAGLYVARVGGEKSLAGRSIVVRFRDDRISFRPTSSKGDPLTVQDTLNVFPPGKSPVASPAPLASKWIGEPLNEKGFKNRLSPWRRMIVEVGPEGIRIEFLPDAQAAGPPLEPQPNPVPLATLTRQTGRRHAWLADNFPAAAAAPVEYEPTGGCGLYVHNATVSFRNVTFQPLP